MKIKENKALTGAIESIKNNPYTEEIVEISEVELLSSGKTITISEIQGDYPVRINFTQMQKVEVTYRNKYFGLFKGIIVAGFDAVRYKDCCNNMYPGKYLSEYAIDVEFVGECAKILKTIRLEETDGNVD